jgi:hypothetical protein
LSSFFRLFRQPLLYLVLVPVIAGVALVVVGPGASGKPVAAPHPSTTTTSVVEVVPAVASSAPVSKGGKPAWVDGYNGRARSSRIYHTSSTGSGSGSDHASANAPAVEAANLAAGVTTTTTVDPGTSTTVTPTTLAVTNDLPPGVVSESSSPIVLILVAVGAVIIVAGGVWFWRRRRLAQ